MNKKKVLFVCDRNRLRSPTAETLYKGASGLEVRSAGLGAGATVALTEELLAWSDIVFVMERRQRNIIHKRWPIQYEQKRIVCLYVPDRFDYMDPVLVTTLAKKLKPYLGRPSSMPGGPRA